MGVTIAIHIQFMLWDTFLSYTARLPVDLTCCFKINGWFI